MTKLNSQNMVQILRSLEQLQADDDDEMAVVAESSFEEAMLVASPQACIKLARELLRVAVAFDGGLVADDLENADIVGQGERMTDSVKYLFDEHADAWPVCICVTPSKEVTRAIRDKLCR